jgi:hypothetical protein
LTITDDRGTGTGNTDDQGTPLALRLVDKALVLQSPLAQRRIARFRRTQANATPNEALRRFNAEFRAATIGAGAGVGAAAAAPGVGTGVALALSGVESVAFLNATVLYVLARSEVQGIHVHDLDRRRALVMAIMLGDAGAKSVQKVAERTGQHWARMIVSGIPRSQILAINKVLGKNFVTRYGTRQGIVVLGRVIPFGIGAIIGAGANAAFSHGVIKAADRAFGEPPGYWDKD